MTAAVEQAVRERLDRVRPVQHTGMAERLWEGMRPAVEGADSLDRARRLAYDKNGAIPR
jgi:hypothetical protein